MNEAVCKASGPICRNRRPLGYIFEPIAVKTLDIFSHSSDNYDCNINNNKCVSRTDTNPPFAFQTAFPGGGDRFQCFYREGQKASYAACKPLFLAVAEI